MFDIAWSHLIIVAVVALIFLGPEELPIVLRTLGRWVGWARRTLEGFTKQLQDDQGPKKHD